MAAKASKKKTGNKDAAKQEAPKKEAPKKRKSAAATAAENRAHHATLSGTECTDCAVGLLRKFASESLRNQRKADPGNQTYHLQDDEELELLRTTPLSLQLVGLRRERSISNRFDDLLVVLYDPALVCEEQKTVLEAEGLRAENLKDAQAFVDAVLADKKWAAPKGWPLPGVDVSCPKCKHWRVLAFPITTEPGYSNKKPAARDEEGNKRPDFDNLTLLPNDVGAIAPGIYNDSYRVGLHKGGINPPESYAAIQFILGTIPARRRYPVSDFLNAAQAAHDQGTDVELCKQIAKAPQEKDAQEKARERLEKELGEKMPQKTQEQKQALAKAVDAALLEENLELYKPRIGQQRQKQALDELDRWLNGYAKKKTPPKINPSERFVRLENASGVETQNFEREDNQFLKLEAVADDLAPMKAGLQIVFKPSPPPPAAPPGTAEPATPPATTPALPKTETPPAPPPPRTLPLTKDEVLVTFGTAAGTNIHRSVNEERSSWRRDREVNNYSEGCQVFRSPQDFQVLLRMAMLAKRALCPNRKASCGVALTVADVEKGIGPAMTTYLGNLPKDFAESANRAIEMAFTPPPPPPPPTEAAQAPKNAAPSVAGTPTAAATLPEPNANVLSPPPLPDPRRVAEAEKLIASTSATKAAEKAFDNGVRAVFESVFKEDYETDSNFALLRDYTRQQMMEPLLLDEHVKKAAEGKVPEAPNEKAEFEKALQTSLDQAEKAALAKLKTQLTEVKTTWLKDTHAEHIKLRHDEFLESRLEPCDFGDCKFEFDYVLAETTRTDIEAVVAKLGSRDWNTLFPEDAPPPPPKPPKKEKAPSRQPVGQGKPPSVAGGASAE
jgi:hypothetical protein